MTKGAARKSRIDRQAMAGLSLAVLATAAVYLAAPANGFIGLDDDVYITANPYIQELTAANFGAMLVRPYAEFYHPVTMLSLAFDRLLWGFNPFGYHLTDVLLHLISTALVFWVARGLVLAGAADPAAARGLARVAALVTALLFGLHPLHVESVAWAAQRKDMLCSAFYLLSFGFYLKHATRSDTQTGRTWYRLSLAAFVLSLLSKSMAVTLPVVLILIDYYPLRRLRALPRHGMSPQERAVWTEKLPFLGLAFAIALATIAAQRRGGALRSSAEVPWSLRPWLVIYSYAFYLWKGAVPSDLTVLYPIADVRPIHAMIWICLGALVAIAAGAFLLRRRLPAFGAAMLYYLVTLAPVCGLMTFGAQSVADRYSYLPLLGPFLLVGLLVARVNSLGDRAWRPSLRAFVGAATATGIFAMARFTVVQIETWRDGQAVWTHHLSIYPKNIRARFNLAVHYQQTGRLDRAISEYRTCQVQLDGDPRPPARKPHYVDVHINLGYLLLEVEKPTSAVTCLQQALDVQPESPGANNYMGLALLALRKPEEALAYFQRTIESAPGVPDGYLNLGLALEQTGKIARARDCFERALSLDVRLVKAHERLGMCFLTLHDLGTARREFTRALSLDRRASDALVGLADVEVAEDHPLRALGHLTRAARFRPDDASLHLKKAKIVEKIGAMGLAESSYRQATTTDPMSYEAYYELGLFLERRERFAEALEAMNEAWAVLHWEEIEARDDNTAEQKELVLPEELVVAITRLDRKVKGLDPAP